MATEATSASERPKGLGGGDDGRGVPADGRRARRPHRDPDQGRRVLDHLGRLRRPRPRRRGGHCRPPASAAATRSGSCSPTGPSSTSSIPPSIHLGATPFSSTTPRPRSRSRTCSRTPKTGFWSPSRRCSTPSSRHATRARPRSRRSSSSTATPRRRDHPRRVRGGRERGLRLRGRLARGRARRSADPDLHLGDDRAAEGRPADPRQPPGDDELVRPAAAALPRRPPRLLAADGSHRRAELHASTADDPWPDRRPAARPAPGRRLPGRRPADLVLRGAADLGEIEGSDGDRLRRRVRRRPQGGGRLGARSRDEEGPRRTGGGGRAAGTGARIREGRRGGPLRPAGQDRPRPGRGGQRRSRSDAARR